MRKVARKTTVSIIILLISILLPLQVFGHIVIEENIEQLKAFTGILVKDFDTKEILFSHNQDMLFTPASLVKIMTLMAGLEIIGEEYRYPTSFYFSSTVPGVIDSSLYIKGSGDPMHSPETIKEISQNLVSKFKISQINGDLILDDFLFQKEEYLGRGWMWDDQNPLIGSFVLQGYSVKEKHNSYYNDMTFAWGKMLYNELLRLGVGIKGDVKIDRVKKDIPIKAVYYSETLDNILAQMMVMSDNQSSEIIFRTLPLIVNSEKSSVSTIEQSIVTFSDFVLKSLGMQWGEDYFIVDGCGLSEYNLLTPSQVVAAISFLYEKYGNYILKYFANNDEKGTIKNRFPFPVWAKTGSLPSASGLAGLFQTKSGRNIIFCLIENNFRGEKNDPKLWENQIIEHIYENF